MKSIFNDILKHHGILGQKWGVRHGPPYPIEDNVLRKGTVLRHVNISANSKQVLNGKRWLYTYNPEDDWDDSVYKGPFALYLKERALGQYDLPHEILEKFSVNAHDFVVTRDLKMPTNKERVDEFIAMCDKNQKLVLSDLKRMQGLLQRHEVGSEEARDLNLDSLTSPDDYKYAYEIFNHMMENRSAFRSTEKYSQIMQKKYDAMVDDNNQGVYNKAHDPIIIFNAKKFLESVGPATVVSGHDTEEHYRKVRNELEKQGERVKL